MSEILIGYIFPRQLGFTNVFTSKEVISSNILYHMYMDRTKELNVNYQNFFNKNFNISEY